LGSIIDINTDLGHMVFESVKNIDLKLVARLHDELSALDLAAPLRFFDVRENDLNKGQFSYEFVALDGRIFRQGIFFNGDEEPSLTFYVPDRWKLSEFILHRPIRDTVVALIKSAGLMRVTVDFSLGT